MAVDRLQVNTVEVERGDDGGGGVIGYGILPKGDKVPRLTLSVDGTCGPCDGRQKKVPKKLDFFCRTSFVLYSYYDS
jgi:hypothetical protein